MPSGGRGRRTNRESEAFKSKIIKLRAQNKSIVKIAKQMGISRQYVSLVLIEAGLGGKPELRKKGRAGTNDKKNEIDTDISRLEQRGEYALANSLRTVAKRRNANRR